MKTVLTFFLLSVGLLPMLGQITLQNNGIRSGDIIIKQQIEYKDPGRTGVNVLWDFSRLKSINPEYKLIYSSPRIRKDSLYIMGKDTFKVKDIQENELIIGREHRTMYYYQVKDNVLYCLGHENQTMLMQHVEAIPVIHYPTSYGQKINKEYRSESLYSSLVPMSTHGNVYVEADALGKMILPSKDTLKHVIRIHSIQTIFSDSIESMDSIRIKTQIENYKWYSKGYRYPVFETIRTIHSQDSIQDVFTTAFFYPPQEHLYLENDFDNIAVLDSLNNIGSGGIFGSDHPSGGSNPMQQMGKFAYNLYPNPVANDLYIEYLLEENATVNISLYDMGGKLIKSLPETIQHAGVYYETVDCTSLSTGNYILRLNVNEKVINEKILKK